MRPYFNTSFSLLPFPLISFFLLLNNSVGISQNTADPIFAPFKGTAYKIPARQKVPGYGKFIYDCDLAGETILSEINVPESDYKTPFPGLNFMHRFGIIFKSEMTITKQGIYTFSLNSDDGSVLWIGNKEIINNDETHKMTIKSDTVLLEKGNYPIKIWYFQGFPDRYGIVFDATYFKEYNPEADKKYAPISTGPKLVFNSTRLPFETNSHLLNKKGLKTLDSLADELNKLAINKITIEGHTDNSGPDLYNKNLSLKRAGTIRTELAKRLGNKNIEFNINGFGSEQPVVPNETESGRSKNRRVEIKINN